MLIFNKMMIRSALY